MLHLSSAGYLRRGALNRQYLVRPYDDMVRDVVNAAFRIGKIPLKNFLVEKELWINTKHFIEFLMMDRALPPPASLPTLFAMQREHEYLEELLQMIDLNGEDVRSNHDIHLVRRHINRAIEAIDQYTASVRAQ